MLFSNTLDRDSNVIVVWHEYAAGWYSPSRESAELLQCVSDASDVDAIAFSFTSLAASISQVSFGEKSFVFTERVRDMTPLAGARAQRNG